MRLGNSIRGRLVIGGVGRQTIANAFSQLLVPLLDEEVVHVALVHREATLHLLPKAEPVRESPEGFASHIGSSRLRSLVKVATRSWDSGLVVLGPT